MKRLITLAAMLAVLGIGVGSSFAATGGSTVPPPKVPPILGPEGPDTRAKVEPKGLESPDIRHRTEAGPMGVEGPEVR